ncbi:MAG: hypothetical protein G01um101419_306 [Parcubacteria group bacterium Gr01-1014_19]|nr:MAG: hypothetical protein G01um101419_306 [Parcubacteria group bacterium Gr01-1014_19]
MMPSSSNGQSMTVYKSPTCGCCGGYINYLKKNNFQITVVETTNRMELKEKFQIPADMESCHTSVVGGYVVEGHVPVEAVNKLLSEKPEIDGISLPEMPAGSPGMGGIKSGPLTVYALSKGEKSEYFIK